MHNFKKKLKRFVRSKGGLATLISLVGVILLALFLIIIGVIYSDYGGDWGRIPEFLGSNVAITFYIVGGLIILALLYIYIIFKRKEDI